MTVSLIAAVARNGVIGRAGALPWRLPEDLKRFKRLTLGHPVVMGRKTFASIGKPLPGRDSIVLSRDPAFRPAGARVARSLEEALALAGSGEVFVIGGEAVYREALPRADRLYLTLLDRDFEGDARFPDYDDAAFRELSRESFAEPLPHAFVVLERVGALT